MSKILRKSADGFVAIRLLFASTLLFIGVLALIQYLQPKQTPPVPPMYKAGECGKNSIDADQEGDGIYWKIIAVGKKNYEMLTVRYDGKKVYVKLGRQSIETLDPGTEKVDCPKELRDPKTLEKAQNGR
ncbi:unnamed protein product [Sphagnum balticum]